MTEPLDFETGYSVLIAAVVEAAQRIVAVAVVVVVEQETVAVVVDQSVAVVAVEQFEFVFAQIAAAVEQIADWK